MFKQQYLSLYLILMFKFSFIAPDFEALEQKVCWLWRSAQFKRILPEHLRSE